MEQRGRGAPRAVSFFVPQPVPVTVSEVARARCVLLLFDTHFSSYHYRSRFCACSSLVTHHQLAPFGPSFAFVRFGLRSAESHILYVPRCSKCVLSVCPPLLCRSRVCFKGANRSGCAPSPPLRGGGRGLVALRLFLCICVHFILRSSVSLYIPFIFVFYLPRFPRSVQTYDYV